MTKAKQDKQPEKTEERKKRCFIVSPIGEPGTPTRTQADWHLRVFEQALKPFDFDVVRSDKESASGDINEQVVRRLLDDDLVIADLSELNPNVFYELGIRHAIGRATILVSDGKRKPPFDVSVSRFVTVCCDSVEEMDRSVEQVQRAITEIVDRLADHDHGPVAKIRTLDEIRATPQSENSRDLIFQQQIDELSSKIVKSKILQERLDSVIGRDEFIADEIKKVIRAKSKKGDVFVIYDNKFVNAVEESYIMNDLGYLYGDKEVKMSLNILVMEAEIDFAYSENGKKCYFICQFS